MPAGVVAHHPVAGRDQRRHLRVPHARVEPTELDSTTVGPSAGPITSCATATAIGHLPFPPPS